MRRFLVPVDGSANALRAVHYAVSLARDESPAEVYLATVQDLREATERSIEPAEELLAKAGIAYRKEFLSGDVAPSIVRCAEDLACDGIVMGTHGAGSTEDIGSVARQVVQLSKLPVTLIS